MEIKDEAGVISLASLMTENIGGQTNEAAEAEKDLKRTLEGKDKPDPFDLGLNEDEETPKGEEEEEEVEDTTPPIIPDADAEEEEVFVDTDTSLLYKESLKSLFGDLESIVQENEKGEEEEVRIEDIVLDTETFNDIVKAKIAEIEEKANQNKISAEGISEFTRSLIEVEKNGGDIKTLLEYKADYLDPLSTLDMETEQGQTDAIYLRLKASGRTDKEIEYTVKGYKADGILGEMAHTAKEELDTAIKAKVESEKKAAEENAKMLEDQMKTYKKEIKDNLSSFELKDSIKAKLVDYATKKDDKGQYVLDNLYRQHRLDPKKASRLALFLADEEEYIKQVTKKEVTETKLEGARKLKVIKSKTNSTTDLIQRNNDKGLISIDSLK